MLNFKFPKPNWEIIFIAIFQGRKYYLTTHFFSRAVSSFF